LLNCCGFAQGFNSPFFLILFTVILGGSPLGWPGGLSIIFSYCISLNLRRNNSLIGEGQAQGPTPGGQEEEEELFPSGGETCSPPLIKDNCKHYKRGPSTSSPGALPVVLGGPLSQLIPLIKSISLSLTPPTTPTPP
jgi:hypothetical protein